MRYGVGTTDLLCLEQYFLDRSTVGLPESLPDDRLCRFCKHVGHFVEQCPERPQVSQAS